MSHFLPRDKLSHQTNCPISSPETKCPTDALIKNHCSTGIFRETNCPIRQIVPLSPRRQNVPTYALMHKKVMESCWDILSPVILSNFWETFERLLRDFWATFERLLGDFWATFERLLGHFWETFERLLRDFWDTFGTLLGHFWDTFGTLSGHFRDTFGTYLGHSRDIFGTLMGLWLHTFAFFTLKLRKHSFHTFSNFGSMNLLFMNLLHTFKAVWRGRFFSINRKSP